jgi:hypothetical protein
MKLRFNEPVNEVFFEGKLTRCYEAEERGRFLDYEFEELYD